MPFPVDTPDVILRRSEARMEAAILRIRPDADPAAVARAVRSEKGLIAALLRDQAMTVYETHLHLRWIGAMTMPDTAEAAWLIRHASIWGVWRRPAVKAVGYATFAGLPGTVIPAGLELRLPAGGLAMTATAGVVGSGGVVGIGLIAALGGAAYNVVAGATLPIVTTLAGLDPQAAVLDADGMQGGAEEEGDPSLLARVLAEIREPGHGGAAFDYPKWVQNEFAAAKVKTVPNWVGPGSVGVVVAMGTAAEPRVPTPAEIAAIGAHLDVMRPVTAEVITMAYLPLVVPMTLAVAPDTAAVRAAVDAARRAFFAAEAEIGGRLARSRLSEAISAASGEYRHYITAPAADIVAAPRELAIPGGITWESAP